MTQEDFFKQAVGKKYSKTKPVALYNELITERFFEVLSNSNPIFFNLVGEFKFRKCVSEFVASGYAKSKLIWQLPFEFRKFIKDFNKFNDMPFLMDLMWLEYSEIEIFMNNFKNFKYKKFDWKEKYKLSISSKIKRLTYRVATKNFEVKQRHYILAYYDFKLDQVIYREISKFIYDFIKILDNKLNLEQVLDKISEKYELENGFKEELSLSLKELCDMGVLN